MKRFLSAALLLSVIVPASAEFSLGVDLSTGWNNNHRQIDSDNDQGTVSYDLYVGPKFLIDINGKLEVVPFFDVTYSRTSSYVDDDLRTLNRWWGYDVGCGIYFRPINGDVFRFSIGPRFLYGMNFDPEMDDYVQLRWFLTAPANIDFRLSDRFFIRASPTIAGVSYTLTTTGEEDAYTGEFNFRVVTQSSLSIGFFFTF